MSLSRITLILVALLAPMHVTDDWELIAGYACPIGCQFDSTIIIRE